MAAIGITGGKGMLGIDARGVLERRGHTTLVFDLPEHDLTQNSPLSELIEESDIIVNCAAYTNVDRAETESKKCSDINANLPGRLGKAAKLAGKRVIHISTDFVFGDGGNDSLDEESQVAPLNVYGKTKLGGEQALLASGCSCAVIRIEWTYGDGGSNFISKIADLAPTLDELKVVVDQVGSPTPTTAVASAIAEFAENDFEGIYHFAANGYASRCEVAKMIVEELGLETDVAPCSSDDFPTPAVRPRNSRFDCSKIDGVLTFERPHWKTALKKYLKEMK
ncbi:MAG: dTDP-4-dehydrorhamnose reductase [Kiritimatiellaeota bacterium]|nr:dTDP-4-dehydrorhamnose reductase [Kiritimatiellota bacterium]